MCNRNWLVWVLVAASAGSLGCRQEPSTEQPVGSIELVLRSTDDARLLGALTLRRNDETETRRLPMSVAGYQELRLSLEPGLYALDFEADVGAALEDPSLESSGRAASGDLPRWVVVAPAQVTTINVATEPDMDAPGIAAAPLAAPVAFR